MKVKHIVWLLELLVKLLRRVEENEGKRSANISKQIAKLHEKEAEANLELVRAARVATKLEDLVK